MHVKHIARSAAVVAALGLAACANQMQMQPPPAAPMAGPQASLYQRLGGKPAIEAVIDRFVANVAADPRINHFFAHTNIPVFKQALVNQVCQVTGGPCVYTGPTMVEVHHGMNITNADFNALVGDLVMAMNALHVPQPDQQQLLAILGPLRSQIVHV